MADPSGAGSRLAEEPTMAVLDVDSKAPIARVTLNRPEPRNALNLELNFPLAQHMGRIAGRW